MVTVFLVENYLDNTFTRARFIHQIFIRIIQTPAHLSHSEFFVNHEVRVGRGRKLRKNPSSETMFSESD